MPVFDLCKRIRIWQDDLFPDCAAGFNGGGRRGIQKGRHIRSPRRNSGKYFGLSAGEYVFYYQVGNDLYQVFYPESPDCETQKIFSSEEPFFSWFLSNYRMLIGYESQAFQEALARINATGVDEPMPQQYDWYVLDIRSGALQRLSDGKNYSAMTEEEREQFFPIEEERRETPFCRRSCALAAKSIRVPTSANRRNLYESGYFLKRKENPPHITAKSPWKGKFPRQNPLGNTRQDG